MATGTENYLSLVRSAFQGDLKLPAFQREFKWTRKQVIRLYDSIRQSYPIGSIIVMEGSKVELKERSFRGANSTAESRATKRLILDGQQRLTAGIDLFYGEEIESISQYFIDIQKLESLLDERNVNLEDENSIKVFLENLDDDDGYCVGRTRTDNPSSLLLSKHLLTTTLLRPDNSKRRDLYLEEYEDKYPDKKKIVRNIIKPYLVINEAPDVPYVAIDSGLQLDAISRIFSTLNSTGKVLTPFELVVAVLFSSHIDLRDDLNVIREAYPIVKNMDTSGDIVLQTVVMLCGKDQKKSLLPKNLTATDWRSNHEKAAKLLNDVGQFLTSHGGMALDVTSDLIPYDSIFAPMALVFDQVGYSSLPPAELGAVNLKLIQWFIGSALSQRYQEGVHNKQTKDAEEFKNWILERSDDYKPSWLSTVNVPPIRLVTTKGAVANLLRCLMNLKTLIDPLTGEKVNFGASNTHAHHLFPKKYVEKLTGWNPKAGDKADLFLNLMQLSAATNVRFLNSNPAEQLADAVQSRGQAKVIESYLSQGILEDAISILQKPQKERDDFHNFLKLRETYFEKLLDDWGFSKVSDQELIDDTEVG